MYTQNAPQGVNWTSGACSGSQNDQNQACSCNHCCSGKAISITFYVHL